MNDIMQLRVQLEKLFEAMGGEKLEEDAATILHDLQNSLNAVMDDLAIQFSLRCVVLLLARLPGFHCTRNVEKRKRNAVFKIKNTNFVF